MSIHLRRNVPAIWETEIRLSPTAALVASPSPNRLADLKVAWFSLRFPRNHPERPEVVGKAVVQTA